MNRLVICLAGALLAACNANKPAGVAEEMVYDSLEWCDSVVLESGAAARVELACMFPKEGGTALADSMRLWILQQFACSKESDEFLSGLREIACKPAADIAESVRLIGQQLLKDDAEEVIALDEDDDLRICVNYERDARIAIAYDNEEYTTLSFTYYVYLAGAHGSTFVNYATFRKSDGHLMDWDLLADMSREELTAKIKQGLCGYFEVSMDELPDQLLLGCIDDEENRRTFAQSFPLPATPPFLTADGVSIVYQQYEIACYAAGMPTCVIKK